MSAVLFSLFRTLVQACSGLRLRRFAPVDRAYRLLFDRLRPNVAWVHGHRLHVDPNDRVVAQSLLLHGTWEPFETELFQQALEPGMVVFCLGAHIGYYAVLAARRVGQGGRVYAFEPGPDSFRLLVKNVDANGYRNVVAVPKAVGNVTGRGRLYLHTSNSGEHRLYPSGEPREFVDVDVVRLDDWLGDRAAAADLIQMDLQGAEMLALEGMEDLVRRSPRARIFTELWPEGLRLAGRSAEEFLGRVTALGFRVHVIDEARRRLVPLAGADELDRYRDVLGIPNYGLNLLCTRP
jgi:FkbM family methyltransferase